jgi:hypothetical protein
MENQNISSYLLMKRQHSRQKRPRRAPKPNPRNLVKGKKSALKESNPIIAQSLAI